MSILETLNMIGEATAEKKGSGFSGVRIPFLTVAEGKTELLFLSDLEDPEGQVPDVRFYRSYPVRGSGGSAVEVNGTKTYDIAYVDGDPLHEVYLKAKEKEGKTPNPQYFSLKGFAYVANLTGIKGVRFFQENNRAPSKKDGWKDINEIKAAKVYIQQYQDALERYNAYRDEQVKKGEEDPGEFTYHGVFIYNFPVTITKGIHEYASTLIEEGYDVNEVSLREYYFTLIKSGSGQNTTYVLSIEDEASTLDEDLVGPLNTFVESNELSDFEGLVERKRVKSDDIGDYRISGVAKEESEEDWS
jgi:hypothetical protein